jgi:hypothetical protein
MATPDFCRADSTYGKKLQVLWFCAASCGLCHPLDAQPELADATSTATTMTSSPEAITLPATPSTKAQNTTRTTSTTSTTTTTTTTPTRNPLATEKLISYPLAFANGDGDQHFRFSNAKDKKAQVFLATGSRAELYECADKCTHEEGCLGIYLYATASGQSRCRGLNALGTVRVFRQEFTLEDAIGSHACSLEANMRVTNAISLGRPFLLPVGTVNCVQTLKVPRKERLQPTLQMQVTSKPSHSLSLPPR